MSVSRSLSLEENGPDSWNPPVASPTQCCSASHLPFPTCGLPEQSWLPLMTGKGKFGLFVGKALSRVIEENPENVPSFSGMAGASQFFRPAASVQLSLTGSSAWSVPFKQAGVQPWQASQGGNASRISVSLAQPPQGPSGSPNVSSEACQLCGPGQPGWALGRACDSGLVRLRQDVSAIH